MTFKNFTGKIWLGEQFSPDDIVISSRIRLARNLVNHKFPRCAKLKERIVISKKIISQIKQIESLKDIDAFSVSEMDDLQKNYFLERHLISPEHAMKSGKRDFLVSQDESLSFMINEEDHLRIQLLVKGYALENNWVILNKIDTELMKKLDFAFSEQYGFLTECPTNVGTGMRASVMLHLPALVLTQKDKNFFSAITKMGIAVRGLYGEGSNVFGHLFQISNQITLGVSEKEILKRLKTIVDQILTQERLLRTSLLEKKKKSIEDKIYRAWGILSQARLMNFSESIDLLSMLWFGVSLNLISGIDRNKLFELFFLVKPAHVQVHFKKIMSPQERDIKRADLIRNYLLKNEMNFE